MICQTSGSILKEKKVLASIAYISSLRLMTSDPEVSFTIEKETGGPEGSNGSTAWLKKSCCLVRVAASLKLVSLDLGFFKKQVVCFPHVVLAGLV